MSTSVPWGGWNRFFVLFYPLIRVREFYRQCDFFVFMKNKWRCTASNVTHKWHFGIGLVSIKNKISFAVLNRTGQEQRKSLLSSSNLGLKNGVLRVESAAQQISQHKVIKGADVILKLKNGENWTKSTETVHEILACMYMRSWLYTHNFTALFSETDGAPEE
jgi:hypothetical protein